MTPLSPDAVTQAGLSPKEIKIYQFIETYIQKKGHAPTYAEIQEKFDYQALSSVQQYIKQLVAKGVLQAPLGDSKKRAISLVQKDKLQNAAAEHRSFQKGNLHPVEASGLVSIPLEGRVAAGRLHEAIQDREYIDIPQSLLKPGNEYFALTVKGDSMIDDCILDGDWVVIKRQTNAHQGQTVVALVNGEATIKRFFQKKNQIQLHPANPNYDIIKVDPDAEFKILGVLSTVIRRYEAR